jgi:hypothetical protein
LSLRNNRDTLLITRYKDSKPIQPCRIKNIKAHVYENGLGLYGNNYKVTYSEDDKLVFQQLSSKDPNRRTETFKMKTGTFKKMCARLTEIQFANLKNTYLTTASEVEVKEIEIELTQGTRYKFHLENDDYPEELMLALIPVLYGHQQYLYGNLPAIK